MTKNDSTLQASRKKNQWLCVELPVTEYREAWEHQFHLLEARRDKIIETDIVLLLEHAPVFTLGRRGGMENLKVCGSFLKKSGIPIVQVERGGDITYHGPGQLIGYPIINLKESRLKVVDYVSRLEEAMIRTVADWGIIAERNRLNRGIWVGNNKLASIGVAIRRGISFHGFALNVNVSLKPFDWIHPCGLKEIGITSMECELSNTISMHKVREAMRRHLEAVFGIQMISTSMQKLSDRLPQMPGRAVENPGPEGPALLIPSGDLLCRSSL